MAHWVKIAGQASNQHRYINADLATEILFTAPPGIQAPTGATIKVSGHPDYPIADASEVTALHQYVISGRKGLVNP